MPRPWIFFINPFLTVTKGSYRVMKQLGDYTLAALTAYVAENIANKKALGVTIFSDLLAVLTPLTEAYDEAYRQWISQQGIQKGDTKSLTNLLDELSSINIAEWDRLIQNVYRQKTPQYIALLPNRRGPFQSGTQQERITAVGALSLAIGSDENLQTLRTEIDTFYDELVAANLSQKGSKSTTDTGSTDVETQRLRMGAGLYGILGSLMNYYQETPEAISNFFYMPALRGKEQSTFKRNIKGGETIQALTRTFVIGDELKLINRGHTSLQLALVHEKNDTMPETAFTLQPNEEEIELSEALGALGNRFLIVKNMSPTEKGAYTIELM